VVAARQKKWTDGFTLVDWSEESIPFGRLRFEIFWDLRSSVVVVVVVKNRSSEPSHQTIAETRRLW